MLKRISINILKFIISLVLITFIFSATFVEVGDVIKNTFGNIFEYASSETKEEVVGKFKDICSSNEEDEPVILGIQLCKDEELRTELEDNCARYQELKSKDKVTIDENLEEICDIFGEEKFERFCSKIERTPLAPDFEGMKKVCDDYNAGNIGDKELFVNYIGSAVGNIQLSKSDFYKNYKNTIQYFETYGILYIFVLVFLLWLLYLLLRDLSTVFIVLSSMLFNISLFLLLPYAALFTFQHIIGIQTDSLLMIFAHGGSTLNINTILGLFLIAIFSFYNNALLTKAVIFFVIGVIGKTYKLTRNINKEKKDEDIKSKSKKAKESETTYVQDITPKESTIKKVKEQKIKPQKIKEPKAKKANESKTQNAKDLTIKKSKSKKII